MRKSAPKAAMEDKQAGGAGTRTTDAQWNELMLEVSHDIELLHGEFQGPNGAVHVQQKWGKIAAKLNKMPGARRNGKDWKKSWQRLKSQARHAYGKRARYVGGTGGGPPPEEVGKGLKNLFNRVIELTGTVAAVGTTASNPLQLQVQKVAAQAEGKAVNNNATNTTDEELQIEKEPAAEDEGEAVKNNVKETTKKKIDINVFKNGEWQLSDHKTSSPTGIKWEDYDEQKALFEMIENQKSHVQIVKGEPLAYEDLVQNKIPRSPHVMADTRISCTNEGNNSAVSSALQDNAAVRHELCLSLRQWSIKLKTMP